MINSMMTTPTSNSSNLMSKSMYTNPIVSPKTLQPIPKMSTFKRTSSLRVSNRKTKPIYIEKTVSNIQRGISDEGPISPNFVKAIDYDELPIRSPYSAIKMVEAETQKQTSPSPVMPSIIHKPVMRDKSSTSIRKNLTLELMNPNKPSEIIPISKTDSMALFLKYESDLSAQLSEKELKDKSNSLSKRTLTMNHNASYNNDKDHKLPDINGKILPKLTPMNNNNNSNELEDDRPLISIDNFNKSTIEKKPTSVTNGNHLAPLKMVNVCDNNLPVFNNNNNTSRSPSIDRKMLDDDSRDSSSSQNSRRSGTTLRRKVKLSKDNFLFDTVMDPDAKSQPSSSDDSNNNSLKRPESRNSKSESVFDDFDFDQFLSTFNDDDKYPIFKDYKKLLNRPTNNDEDNFTCNKEQSPPIDNKSPIFKELSPNTKAIQIQNVEPQMSGIEKLDSLCKMLSNPSDSDESNSLETDPIERNTSRSKSSADSAYGR